MAWHANGKTWFRHLYWLFGMSGDFVIGQWRAQPSLNRLTRGEEVVRLEPKVMQVLVCLADGGGEVVTREELIARVWPDVFVTDDVLHRAIGELRRVFGDSHAAPRYIETIRKRGYRLVLENDEDSHRHAGSMAAAGLELTRRRWAFSVAAAVLVALCGLLLLVMASPARDEGSQAFARFVPLVSGPLNETDPGISPDGLRVAFVQRDQETVDADDIYIRELATGRVTRFGDHPGRDRYPAWSNDGSRLVFARFTAASCEFVVRSIAESTERRVAACGNVHEARVRWAPDDRGLLTSQAPSAQAHLGWRVARIDLETAAIRMLTEPPPGSIGDHTPVSSPDGRQVAFIRHLSGGASDLYVVPIDGGIARRVTWDDADLTGVDWSSDGRSLVYSSDRAGGYSLWQVSVDGGTSSLLAGGAARMKHPVADRAGRRVLYESWNYEINLWETPLQEIPGLARHGGTSSPPRPQAVTRTSDLWNLHPTVSPDGTRVAYVSTQSGRHELWIANRDGANARQLTHLNRGAVKEPKWSPDGRRIVYLAREAAGVDVYVIDVDSQAVMQLTATPATEVAPAWASDGGAVLFGAPASDGDWTVWSLPIRSGASARPAIANAVAAQTSVDGQWLYFTRPDRPGVWRMRPTRPADAELVTGSIAPGNTSGWAVTTHGVFYVTAQDEVVRLRLAPLAGGSETEVATLDRLSWPGFAVTSDGRTVVYARWDRRESNIVAIEY
jgi:Tol biopolymer transport system component/DNA-binding winged helix-turn-helix (wHTH) protein